MDKFSYYDTLSNIIPGLLLIWALSILGPFRNSGLSYILTGNPLVDPILLLAISFVIGHILQFFSKYSIEILVKKVFWKGYMFSEIFLISSYNYCNKTELTRYLDFSEKELKISTASLDLLSNPDAIKDPGRLRQATEVSHTIYRIIDAKASDTSKGQKAQLHNYYYSFFRNMACLFFLFGFLDLIATFLGYFEINLENVIILLINFILVFIFMFQAKQRGEYYIRGLFWSYI